MRFVTTGRLPFSFEDREVCSVGAFAGLLPPLGARVFAARDPELAQAAGVPEPKVHRSLSRSGVLLLTLFADLRDELARTGVPRGRVGLYGSVPPGLTFAASFAEAARADGGGTEILRRTTPPKQIFHGEQNVPLAQLGIFLGVDGPSSSFTHPAHGALHAAEAAELDFREGRIDAAIIAAAFGLDNPLANFSAAAEGPPGAILREAAVAAVLDSRDDARALIRSLRDEAAPARFFHGPAEGLVRLAGAAP